MFHTTSQLLLEIIDIFYSPGKFDHFRSYLNMWPNFHFHKKFGRFVKCFYAKLPMKGSPWHAWSLFMQLLLGTCLQMDRLFFITHNTKNSPATQRIPMTCGFLRQHTELPTLLPKKRASSNSCFRGSRLCRFTLLSITTQPTKQRKTMTIHSHLHLNMRPFNKRSNVLAKCQLEN